MWGCLKWGWTWLFDVFCCLYCFTRLSEGKKNHFLKYLLGEMFSSLELKRKKECTKMIIFFLAIKDASTYLHYIFAILEKANFSHYFSNFFPQAQHPSLGHKTTSMEPSNKTRFKCVVHFYSFNYSLLGKERHAKMDSKKFSSRGSFKVFQGRFEPRFCIATNPFFR